MIDGRFAGSFRVRVKWGAAVLFIFLAPLSAGPSQRSTDSPKYWYWFQECPDARKMGFNVVVDSKRIYHGEFSACHMERENIHPSGEEKQISFHFAGGRIFPGGDGSYLPERYYSKPTENIEGGIWQAGADPNDLILGLSLSIPDKILLNTAYIVYPGKATKSSDDGIEMKTYPLK